MVIEHRRERRTYSGTDCLLGELPQVGWTRPRSAHVGLKSHRHLGWEICWLRRGTVDWWAGQRLHTVPPGHLYVTQPGEEHGGVHSLLERCDLFWLHVYTPRNRLPGLPTGESQAILAGLANLPQRVFPGVPELGNLWTRILEEHGEHGPYAATAARAALHSLLVTVLRCSASHAARAPTPAIAQAMEHALKRIAQGISVAEMAHVAGLSPSRFHARFSAEVGETPADFLRRRRVHHAKHLLASTRRDITDLALSLGFPTSQYFATVFKRYLGMSPRTYREQARHAPT